MLFFLSATERICNDRLVVPVIALVNMLARRSMLAESSQWIQWPLKRRCPDHHWDDQINAMGQSAERGMVCGIIVVCLGSVVEQTCETPCRKQRNISRKNEAKDALETECFVRTSVDGLILHVLFSHCFIEIKYPCHSNSISLVPHKAVAEVSKIRIL